MLVLHAIGMGFAAGISVAFDLRVLGVASQVPFAAMRRFFPVLWAGFWLNAASGVLLLAAYPTKALTNPVFYLKLVLIAVGMVLVVRMRRDVLRDEARRAERPGRALRGIGHDARPRGPVDPVLGRRRHGGTPAGLHLHAA